MHRALYVVAIGYLAICGMVVLRRPVFLSRFTNPEHIPATLGVTDAATAWWQQVRARCNPVEVELTHRLLAAPPTLEGQGYSAACYALAGKLDSARAIIDRLPQTDRYRAAGIVFDAAHPIADAGDDRAAGPIMELVIGYWPNHYMALYHAGMAEYSLGEMAPARRNLTAFLSYYQENDGWTSRARQTLARIDGAP